jgi:beta-glucosidase
MFDPQELVPFASIGPEVVNCPEYQALAYEAAVQSMVLLQNKNNVLPLNRDSISNIFVAGPTAADIQAMVGNYNGWSGNIVTFLEGITDAVDAGTVVDYSLGCQMTVPGNYQGFWEAKMSDVIIVCLGNSKFTEGEEGEAFLNPNGGDRSDIRLPESQREYIRLLRQNVHGTPIIAVVTGGSAIALQEVLEYADAVIMAWYPGEQGGKALADILFGIANPSGKLPVTFYTSVDDLPQFDDYSMKGRTYKYFKGEPLFPFGYGLNYATFDLNQVTWEKNKYKSNEPIRVILNIQNTGHYKGDEIILVYAAKEQIPSEGEGSEVSAITGSLIGFKRMTLEPGEAKLVNLLLDLQDLHHWDLEQQRYLVEAGTYLFGLDPLIDPSHVGYLGRIIIE